MSLHFAFILFILSILSKESGISQPLKYGEFWTGDKVSEVILQFVQCDCIHVDCNPKTLINLQIRTYSGINRLSAFA